MSYLDTPRIHFAGQFFTDPSTINNATENYNLDEVYNNNPPSPSNPNSVWWNQYGQAFFKIQPGTTVTSAFNEAGQQATNDPVVGAQIVSVIAGGPPTPQYGRLVDLDPDQQSRSMIVGLRLQLTISDGKSRQPVATVTGTVRPMTIIDLWGRAQGGSPGSITFAGCMYQSVMDSVEWSGVDGTSPTVLGQLFKVSQHTLSFKMVVDSYNGDITSGTFGHGRVVGTIGPYFPDEPIHFLAQRRLFLNAEAVNGSPMNNAPFQLKGNRLTIDLGNSVPTAQVPPSPQNPNPSVGGFLDLGTVEAVIDPLLSNVTIAPPIYATVADYTSQYQLTAGIFDVELDQQSAQLLQGKPLAIRINSPQPTQAALTGLAATRMKEGLAIDTTTQEVTPASIALAEFQDGRYVDVDFNGLRLQKGAPAWDASASTGTEITSTAQIPLVATQWGARLPNLAVAVSSTFNWYQFPDSDGNAYMINNSPMSAVSWTSPVMTDASGRANLTFTAMGLDASQRAPRRKDIDSQLYLFDFSYSRYVMMQEVQPITLLVFEDTPVVQNPTWWQNVYPIFLQYAKMYPAMRDLIDLSDYASVKSSAAMIKTVLNLPLAHPGYMPVTRDLSLVNRQMITSWFDGGMPEGKKPTKQPAKKPAKKAAKKTTKKSGAKKSAKKATTKKAGQKSPAKKTRR